MNLSYYIIPIFILVIFISALLKKIDAYSSFLTGVKEGVKLVYDMMPSMLGLYISVSLLSRSGFFDFLVFVEKLPKELLLQGIFRPFSSQASQGFMIQIFESYGVDSKEGYISSLFQGSTDSSLYIMTLYFSTYKIYKNKLALFIGLMINVFVFIICIIMYTFIIK